MESVGRDRIVLICGDKFEKIGVDKWKGGVWGRG